MNWKEKLTRYGRAEEPLLLIGETGVGKERAAAIAHKAGHQPSAPFVPVNCGAIPVSLIEAELFGVDRGAFTGAQSRPGLVAAANHGTLFLDEIGELPMAAQAALLRFLDSGECRRVGGTKVYKVFVRIIAATNRSLVEEIRANRFRLDLYHRLAALVVDIPPLRRRTDEIAGILGVHAMGMRFSDAAMERLRGHLWPGNIRELLAVVARLRAGRDPRDPLLDGRELVQPGDLDIDDPMKFLRPTGAMQAAKTDMIRRALERTGGNVRAAARELGVSHTTIYRALERDS